MSQGGRGGRTGGEKGLIWSSFLVRGRKEKEQTSGTRLRQFLVGGPS